MWKLKLGLGITPNRILVRELKSCWSDQPE